MVQFVGVLGVSIGITPIPAMLESVGAGPAMEGPLATAYAMFFGGLLVLGARLGRMFGPRKVLLAGLAGFGVGSAAGGLSLEAWHLVTARALQGACAAISVPVALGLLLAVSPDERSRNQALALWGAAGAVAGSGGFFVGGVLTDLWDWRSVFWLNLPMAVLLIVGVLTWIAANRAGEPGVSLDVVGASLLTGSVMAVVAGAALVEQEGSGPWGTVIMGLGVLGGLALAGWSRRAREPILPAAAIRNRRLALGSAGSFINTAATSSTSVLLTLHLQQQSGLSAFGTGLLLLSVSGGAVAGSAAASVVIARSSRRAAVLSGLTLIAAANLAAAVAVETVAVETVAVETVAVETVAGIVAALAALGAGLGLSSVGCINLGTDVPEAHTSTATGVLNTGAQLGTAIGVAALVLVAAPERYGTWSGTTVALVAGGTAALLTAAAMARPLRRAEQPA